MNLSFDFEPINTDRDACPSLAEELAQSVSMFEITVNDRVIYREDHFPVLELAVALHRWAIQLKDGSPSVRDFEFESMSFEEPGAVWIRKYGQSWRVGSCFQDRAAIELLTTEDIRLAVDELFEEAISCAASRWAPEIRELADSELP